MTIFLFIVCCLIFAWAIMLLNIIPSSVKCLIVVGKERYEKPEKIRIPKNYFYFPADPGGEAKDIYKDRYIHVYCPEDNGDDWSAGDVLIFDSYKYPEKDKYVLLSERSTGKYRVARCTAASQGLPPCFDRAETLIEYDIVGVGIWKYTPTNKK